MAVAGAIQVDNSPEPGAFQLSGGGGHGLYPFGSVIDFLYGP